MRPVWYLSVSPSAPGLLLPSELPIGIYMPGLFVLETHNQRFDDEYTFLAVRNSNVIPLTLAHLAHREFVTRIDDFLELSFHATPIHYLYAHYLGEHQRLVNHGKLWRLELELQDHNVQHRDNSDFYLVGYGGHPADDEFIRFYHE